MFSRTLIRSVAAVAVTSIACQIVLADPCGMIPPIYEGPGAPITRVGEQQTYVFYKNGVESFVIRPGFSGKVDEFGMLIPFPTPPTVRKVPDHIFAHLANAVDPPEVVIDLSPQPFLRLFGRVAGGGRKLDSLKSRRLKEDQVRVIRKEAVGMYEVAVLEAGSAKALKRWIDEHCFRYPDGMDNVTNDYVKLGWCFVAVKTKVAEKTGVDPKPGQRKVKAELPAGSGFDGFVQAMGFRFKTDELVVPMRLSAFNEGELRNIVYLLTDGPRKIRSIPEEYVMRQIPGSTLIGNVTNPLPLRIIGGSKKDLTPAHMKGLAARRAPEQKNGAAKELFASDLLAVETGQLSLPQEEREKELLRIGESLGLRGKEVDELNADTLSTQNDKMVKTALKNLSSMTLTVVDGDFPREVLANQNLTFAEYRMSKQRNTPRSYNATLKGPAPPKNGIVILGQINNTLDQTSTVAASLPVSGWVIPLGILVVGISLLLCRRRLA